MGAHGCQTNLSAKGTNGAGTRMGTAKNKTLALPDKFWHSAFKSYPFIPRAFLLLGGGVDWDYISNKN